LAASSSTVSDELVARAWIGGEAGELADLGDTDAAGRELCGDNGELSHSLGGACAGGCFATCAVGGGHNPGGHGAVSVTEVVGAALGMSGRCDDRGFDPSLGDLEFTQFGVEHQTRKVGPAVRQTREFDGDCFHDQTLSNKCSTRNS
jgi:hypothetical protein